MAARTLLDVGTAGRDRCPGSDLAVSRRRGPRARTALPVLALALALGSDEAGAQTPLADPLPDIDPSPWSVRLEDLVSTLVFPTDVAVPPDGSPRLFVTRIDGRVHVLVDDVLQPQPFVDLSALYFESNGSAMASLAFHPDFAVNRRLYVVMTENQDPALADFGVPAPVAQQSVLYELVAQDDWPAAGAGLADPAGTRELLRINERATIHNLNDMAFGPDGYLYLLKGDDVSGGHDLTTIHGSVLRLDVDRLPGNPLSANGEYALPADNPHLGAGGGVVEEIWAHGFRNPWRLAFDGDELWVGDVGESDIEELNRVVPGGDHGWPWKEGSFAAIPGGVSDDLSGLPPGSYADPVGEYDHGQSDDSVTGGVIYRGSALPQLDGRYLFGEWISGRLFEMDTTSGVIRALGIDPTGAEVHGQNAGFPWEGIISMAVDAEGELLLVVTRRDDSPTGRLVRVVPDNWHDLGQALAPLGATAPRLTGAGSLLPGEVAELTVAGAAPLAWTALVVGLSPLGAPFKGGVLVPHPDVLFDALTTDVVGGLSVAGAWPADVPPGTDTWYQAWVADPAGPFGFSASNGLRGTTP